MTTTRATEARDLLFGCLRFAARYPDGTIKPGAPPVPYDERFDDRTPVAFEFPTDTPPHTDGPNQVWNAIVALPHLDGLIDEYQELLTEAEQLLHRLLEAPDADAFRLAIVAATRWLEADEGDRPYIYRECASGC